jgi:ankyrin repeat protein
MVTYSLYKLLQRAIHDGRDSDVQELLQRSEPDTIKTLGNNENSLLNDAASRLQLKIMSLLIENGVTR